MSQVPDEQGSSLRQVKLERSSLAEAMKSCENRDIYEKLKNSIDHSWLNIS